MVVGGGGQLPRRVPTTVAEQGAWSIVPVNPLSVNERFQVATDPPAGHMRVIMQPVSRPWHGPFGVLTVNAPSPVTLV
jgi:hypothetical protein